MTTPAPAYNPKHPDVVNGGFTISFDQDYTGAMIKIRCPKGQVISLWESGPDTSRPIIYAWESASDEENSEEPSNMIIMKRFGETVDSIQYQDKTLVLVERSITDKDAAVGEFFYTVHSFLTKDANWAKREVEGCEDSHTLTHYETRAEGCAGMGELLGELMKERLQS